MRTIYAALRSPPIRDGGDLVEFDLEDPFKREVMVRADRDEYTDRLQEIDRQYGSPAVDDLPNPSSHQNAFSLGISCRRK